MRNFALFAAAAAVVTAQSTDVVETAPPMGVYKTEIWQPLVTATTILDEPTETAAAKAKRDVVCVAQPTGISHLSVPDSATGFLADPFYPAQASAAVLPSGYSSIYINSQASNNADNYMGYTLMDTYDVKTCGDKCSAMDGCSSFNIYFERDPSVNPDDSSCSNPKGVTQIKCVWWGGIIDKATNVNNGQWRNLFQVVIAGSNAYVNKASASIAATYVSTAPAAATTVANNAGSNYAIYYSSDSTVGAFSNAAASSSYTDCTTACDNTATCKAFTYVGGTNGVGSGTCWLKTSLGSPSKSGTNVLSGVKVAAPVAAVNAVSTTTSSVVPSSTTTSSVVPTTTTTTTSSPVPTTTSAATTTSKATTSTSTTPAVTTGTPFYMYITGSSTSADGTYAQVASGANGKVTFVSGKTSATKFAFDSNKKLVVYSTGYAANVAVTDGSWADLVFNTASQDLPYASCFTGDRNIIICSANGSFQYAGVCSADSYSTLFFGLQSKTPQTSSNTCNWTGLYQVAV